MKEYLLAIDIGTSATKAVIYDSSLNHVSIVSRAYQQFTPHSGWCEQDADTILHSFLEAMRESLQGIPPDGKLAGIVLSSQMNNVLAVNGQGRPLTRSLIWSDTRSAEYARQLSSLPEADQVFCSTGCPIQSLYPLSKIAWIKDNIPLPETVRFISIKEFIVFHLTGRYISDWSVAASSGLMDIHLQQWHPQALAMAGIRSENLSDLASPSCVLHDWKPEAASLLHIPPGTPLILGGGDGPLASLGMGSFTPDVVTVNVGTSAAARCIISQPVIDPSHRLWTYTLDKGMWITGGMTSSGGIIYDWLLKQFFSGFPVKEGLPPQAIDRAAVEKMAARIPPGAEGLLFTPYLSGEQCPGWQPYTRGSFHGLDLTHTQAHMARAVLEGISFSIYRIIETIQQVLYNPIREVRITGGLGTSRLWTQIAADMFGIPLVVSNPLEGSARGAAMLGWKALGRVASLHDFDLSRLSGERIYPRHDIHNRYMEQYQDFQKAMDCARGNGINRPPQSSLPGNMELIG